MPWCIGTHHKNKELFSDMQFHWQPFQKSKPNHNKAQREQQAFPSPHTVDSRAHDCRRHLAAPFLEPQKCQVWGQHLRGTVPSLPAPRALPGARTWLTPALVSADPTCSIFCAERVLMSIQKKVCYGRPDLGCSARANSASLSANPPSSSPWAPRLWALHVTKCTESAALLALC